MKKLILILFLATNVSVAQKKVALVITGYDTKMDDWEKSNVTFVDTSYWVVNEPLLGTKDTLKFGELNPFDKSNFQICTAYSYIDYYGSQTPIAQITLDTILIIVKQKLISLGKL